MKKLINFLWASSVALLIIIVLPGCSKDDSDLTSDSTFLQQMLQKYKWVSDHNYDLMEWGDEDVSFTDEVVTLFFLPKGECIGKSVVNETDSYFGSSKKETPFKIRYSISQGRVYIDGEKYTYSNDYLTSSSGIRYKKEAITTSDNIWLEDKKYYLMDDKERYDFTILHECSVFSTFTDSGKKHMVIHGAIGVPESAKAHSRGISYLKALFSIKSGGKWDSKELCIYNFINDNNQSTTDDLGTIVLSAETAKITVDVFASDARHGGEEIYLTSFSYTLSANGNSEEDGDDNDDENSDNNDDGDDEASVDVTAIDAEYAADYRRGPVSSSFSGSGTSSSPYLIQSAADLRLLSDKVRSGMDYSGKHFKLTTDITINSGVQNAYNFNSFERWIPIGRGNKNAFCGTFDGDGHTISGIYCYYPSGAEVGLFGYCGASYGGKVYSGTIKNLTIKDSYFKCYGGRVGAFIARGYSNTILNCRNYAKVENEDGMASGIICSSLKGITIKNCINYGNIKGTSTASGIYSHGSGKYSISQCANLGEITGGRAAGVLYSNTSSASGAISSCVNQGRIKGDLFSGGIVSLMYGSASSSSLAELRNCLNAGEVICTSSDGNCGGIAGKLGKNINMTNCLNVGKVSGGNAGLLCSYIGSKCTIKNNHFLLESGVESVHTKNGGSASNNYVWTSYELSTSEPMSILNSKKKSGDSSWAMGYYGYPVLSWALDL